MTPTVDSVIERRRKPAAPKLGLESQPFYVPEDGLATVQSAAGNAAFAANTASEFRESPILSATAPAMQAAYGNAAVARVAETTRPREEAFVPLGAAARTAMAPVRIAATPAVAPLPAAAAPINPPAAGRPKSASEMPRERPISSPRPAPAPAPVQKEELAAGEVPAVPAERVPAVPAPPIGVVGEAPEKAEAEAAEPPPMIAAAAKKPAAPSAVTPRIAAAPEAALPALAAPVTPAAVAAPVPVAISGESPSGILAQLAEVPPTQAASALEQAEAASATALERQKQDVENSIPEVPAPTGLPAREHGAVEKPRAVGVAPKTELAGEKSDREGPAYETVVEPAPAAPSPTPTRLPGPDVPESESAAAEAADNAQGALDAVEIDTGAINITAGERPSVDTSGEADPSQMAAFELESGNSVSTARQQAAREVSADYGENDIFPEPPTTTLKTTTELHGAKVPAAKLPPVAALPPEAATFDQSLAPVLAERIGAKKTQYDAAEVDFDQDKLRAREKANADMAQLEDDARRSQTAEQARAKESVTAARAEWRGEIDMAEADYQERAGKAGVEHRAKVAEEKTKGEQEAARHLEDAEKKAAEEKRQAEGEAEGKKQEAKKESGGFWGWAKRAVSALIDGLKAAVNFIYDKLRKAVKFIFEAAKKLVLAAIELARKAIVLAIKGFGALLKGLVSVALAAFPKIRDRINAKIDKAVDTAVKAVNKAAEWLKKGAAAVLDFLANTLDSLLGLIQSIYNGVFTVIGMLVRGEFHELMRRIWNLVEAAKTAPEQFETAALEELLGGNLDQPLSPLELMQAGLTPPAAEAGASATPATAEPSEMPVPPWTTDNVRIDEMDSNMELSPDLAADLADKTKGDGELELASSEDESRTMTAVMAEVSPEGEAAAKGGVDEEPKYPDDGLTPRKRAEIKWQVMKDGIAKWWSENWPTVLAAAAAALLGFIALNIVTGGAITAALPAIMGIIGPLFIGLTVLKLVEYIKDYIDKGWNGQIRPAGKSLAKGLAAGAIELISYLTFKAGGAVLKGAKALAKGGVKLAKAGLRLAKAGLKVLARGVKFVIEKGKVLFRGIARGLGKIVSRVEELGERLLERLRFRKFRIRLANRRFILEGFINPWVIIAEGEISVVKKGAADAKFVTEKELEAVRSGGKPKAGPLAEGEAGSYKDLTKKGVKADDLTPDHIPSKAALVKAEEVKRIAAREAALGRKLEPVEIKKLKLTPEEVRKINQEGVTIATERKIHQAGRTFGGKNVPSQIALDAKDLGTAFGKDAKAILAAIEAEGKLTPEVVGSYLHGYRANVMKGVFAYSKDIDDMFMHFLKAAAKK